MEVRVRVGWIGLLLIVAGVLAGCAVPAGRADGALRERPIRVVATTGMIADIAKNVGGERVEVAGLMGPGVDPHLYKASEGDVTLIGSADVIFYNGLHLEAGMAKVFERIGDRLVISVAVTDPIDRG
ncbi:MAG TPA: zinc ABC transporter substrate-binding protein, partial [Anaerolineales bacterium]|nr:zinc ABC transporter substrate-binding protein [Anaerolineales bacterium]